MICIVLECPDCGRRHNKISVDNDTKEMICPETGDSNILQEDDYRIMAKSTIVLEE